MDSAEVERDKGRAVSCADVADSGVVGAGGVDGGVAGLGETAVLGIVVVDEGFNRFKEAESPVSPSSAERLEGNDDGLVIDEQGSSFNIR